jgi:acetoin utilization protein AcuB
VTALARTPYDPTLVERARTVADVMVTPVLTSTPEATANSARRLLRRARIRHLPVVENGLLVGIVSDRDLARAPNDLTPLRELMTSTVFVANPSTPLRQAARRFRERHFGAMPVMDGRDIVGIVSVVDVLAALGGSAPGAEPSGTRHRAERGVSGGASARRTSSAP